MSDFDERFARAILKANVTSLLVVSMADKEQRENALKLLDLVFAWYTKELRRIKNGKIVELGEPQPIEYQ